MSVPLCVRFRTRFIEFSNFAVCKPKALLPYAHFVVALAEIQQILPFQLDPCMMVVLCRIENLHSLDDKVATHVHAVCAWQFPSKSRMVCSCGFRWISTRWIF